MQEDNNLKNLLQQFAIENSSAGFTENIMQRIEASKTAKRTPKPLVNVLLLRILAGVFILVLGLLLVLCFSNQIASLPLPTNLMLPENYTSQLISFIVVFWVVLLPNVIYQLKIRQAVKDL